MDNRVVTHTADGISAAAIVGAAMGYLPAFAALAAIIWYCVQIWESKSVQKWVRLRRLQGIRKRRALRGTMAVQAQVASAKVEAAEALAQATLDTAQARAVSVLAKADADPRP